MSAAERTHEITQSYADWAARLDDYMGFDPPIANWFHFATWGTWTVGHVIRSSMGTPMAEALARGQERIYENVTHEAQRFVDGHLPVDGIGETVVSSGFICYRMALNSGVTREDAADLMARGTTHIVAYEQELINDDIKEAFDSAGYYTPEMITKMLSVTFPLETLMLGEDVKGYPGTAATDWRELNQRLRWTQACCLAYQEDESLHSSPYADA